MTSSDLIGYVKGSYKDVFMKYYVHYSGVSVFVKDYELFEDQGGLREPWGKNWKPLIANSIEEARELGYELFEVERSNAQRNVNT